MTRLLLVPLFALLLDARAQPSDGAGLPVRLEAQAGRGDRQVDFEKLSFAGGVFVLHTGEAGGNDPARRARVLLRLQDDGRLVEVRP